MDGLADNKPVSFELYSNNGRLLGSYATEVEAQRHLDATYHAKFLVGVATNGDRICLRDRTELR